MQWNGIVHDGRVEIEAGPRLPEGANVTVLLAGDGARGENTPVESLGQWLNAARALRDSLPETGDSTGMLRELRSSRAAR